MAGNKSLRTAKKAKKDEFYTQLEDIEDELKHYKHHFKDKIIFCNCDDPYESNFFKYFAMNFNQLGLKKLIATCYSGSPVNATQLKLSFFGDDGEKEEEVNRGTPHKIVISEVTDINGDGATNLADVAYLLQNDKNVLTRLKGDGDFRSKECIDLMKEADIVVTNPPFSLFREYVAQLMNFNKKFLIIGNKNAFTYKEIFNLVKDNKLWIGVTPMSKEVYFNVPQHYIDDALENNKTRSVVLHKGIQLARSQSIWMTNLDHKKRHEKLDLFKKYDPNEYPTYDNYNAINCNLVSEIPADYDGYMGVPISFLDKYNPDQFEIVTLGIGEGNFTPTKKYGKFRDATTGEYCSDKRDFLLYIKDTNGKYLTDEGYRVTKLYARIIIRKKQ